MFHFRNSITHPNSETIADKVNFFADVFDFTLTNIGDCGFPDLENHISLLEKIRHHLNFYTDFSKKHINHFIQHRYLNKNDNLISKYYYKNWKLINTLKQHKIDFDQEHSRLKTISDLSDFISILDENLFKNSLSEIIKIFHCPEGLKQHNHIKLIQYHTPILVSEFLLNGFTTAFLSSIFTKILSKQLDPEHSFDDNITPLPESLLDSKYSNPDKFYHDASEYLDNRTLQQQFEGIYLLLKGYKKPRELVFKLKNIKSSEPIDLLYDNLRISNSLKKEKTNSKTNKAYKSFFSPKEALFVSFKVSSSDDKSGYNDALRQITKRINHVNLFLDREITVESNDYLTVTGIKGSRHESFTKYLQQKHQKVLDKNNIQKYIEPSNPLATKIYSLDEIFLDAETSKFIDLKLSNYWRYLECFFPEETQKALIVEKVSFILSLHTLHHLRFLQNRLVSDLIFSSLNSTKFESALNRTRFEIEMLLHNSYKSTRYLKPFTGLVHPYLNPRLKNYLSTTKSDKELILKNYYSNLLFETYEQRNLIQHSGTFNEKSVIKCLVGLPYTVASFRKIMVDTISMNKYSNYNQITKFLSKKYSVKLIDEYIKNKFKEESE